MALSDISRLQVTDLDPAAIAAFITLQVLGGHVGMVIILSTIFFSSRIVRHPVFVNFLVTWMLYALSYSLLLYTGQIMNPTPNFALCLTQGAMIYAAPVMGGMSVFMFTLHLYLILRQSVGDMPPKWPRLRLGLMLAAPYLAYLLMFVIALFMGYSRPEKIHRSSFYCTISIGKVTTLAGGFSAVSILAAIVVETLTVLTVHRHWKSFRRGRTGISVSILVRTFIVLIVSLIAFMTCMAFLANLASSIPNFVLASLPVAAFIVFGTQTDFMQVWFFCCMREKENKQTQSTGSDASTLVGPIVPPKDELYRKV